MSETVENVTQDQADGTRSPGRKASPEAASASGGNVHLTEPFAHTSPAKKHCNWHVNATCNRCHEVGHILATCPLGSVIFPKIGAMPCQHCKRKINDGDMVARAKGKGPAEGHVVHVWCAHAHARAFCADEVVFSKSPTQTMSSSTTASSVHTPAMFSVAAAATPTTIASATTTVTATSDAAADSTAASSTAAATAARFGLSGSPTRLVGSCGAHGNAAAAAVRGRSLPRRCSARAMPNDIAGRDPRTRVARQRRAAYVP